MTPFANDPQLEEILIVIADDHPIVRSGLRTTIESAANLRVVAEAGDGLAALKVIQELQPHVAILDVNMPELGGFALLRQLRMRDVAVAVIFLTIHSDEVMFNEALELGALGYVLKESAVTDIVASIKAVAAGTPYYSPALTQHVLNRTARLAHLTQNKASILDLTPTECRILRLVAANKESKDIADELDISYRTVENHRANICRKLGLQGHNVLLRFALEHKTELL